MVKAVDAHLPQMISQMLSSQKMRCHKFIAFLSFYIFHYFRVGTTIGQQLLAWSSLLLPWQGRWSSWEKQFPRF